MRVLFIGNSHTYMNDMPATFAELWETEFAEHCEVTMLSYSDRSLEWHRQECFAVRFNLLYGGYDVCVIQQQAHPFPGYEATEKPLEWILTLCAAAGTRPVLVETWAEKAAPEHQQIMREAYDTLAAKYGVTLAPVGRIWEELRRSHGEIELFWKDGEHASVCGDYLIAVTLCDVISGTPGRRYAPKAHAYLRSGGFDPEKPDLVLSRAAAETVIPADVADVLQAAAEQAVFGA